MKLYFVSQYRSGDWPNVVWDLQGVFDTFDQAILACKTGAYSVTEIELNQELPEETTKLPTYYPIQGQWV